MGEWEKTASIQYNLNSDRKNTSNRTNDELKSIVAISKCFGFAWNLFTQTADHYTLEVKSIKKSTHLLQQNTVGYMWIAYLKRQYKSRGIKEKNRM